MTERILDPVTDEKEYKRLNMAAGILTSLDEEGNSYIVRDCYLDYGANWKWTTILKINPREEGVLRSCQYITSSEWEEIISAESNIEVLEAVKKILLRKIRPNY